MPVTFHTRSRRRLSNIMTTSKVPWAMLATLALAASTANAQDTSTTSSKRHHHHHHPHQHPWNLPTSILPRPTGRAFLEECESLAAFVAQLRGGASGSGSSYGNDDYYSSSSSSRRYYDNDNDDDEEHYYDYTQDTSNSRRRSSSASSSALFDNMPSMFRTGNRQIGTVLLGSGSFITILGMSLFFNKALMRLGNLLFIAGVPMALGPSRTFGYFFQPQKARATACLAAGIFLVFIGMPMLGMILEIFGLLNLFGNMFPVIFAVAKTMPIIGPVLKSISGNNNNRRQNDHHREDKEDYYERGYDRDPYYDDRGRRDGRDDSYQEYSYDDRPYY